jgi:hypothetical protein
MSTNYEITAADATSPYHSGKGRSYVVTYRGRLIGHLDIHASGYRDWQFNAGAGPVPSATTQQRLLKSVRNVR